MLATNNLKKVNILECIKFTKKKGAALPWALKYEIKKYILVQAYLLVVDMVINKYKKYGTPETSLLMQS